MAYSIEQTSKENWEHHRSIRIDAIKALDNVIFVVATGALGLSVGTIAYLPVGLTVLQSIFLLSAWVFLLLSLACSGISHTFNARASVLHMEHLEKFIRGNFKDLNSYENGLEKDKRLIDAGNICAWSRFMSIVFLLFGTFSLLIFGGSIIFS